MGLFSSVKKAVGSVAKVAVPAAIGYYTGGSSGAMSSMIGPLISGGMSYLGQSSANAFNAEEAAKNRQWQEQMRATQYQTAVKDMQAAGLNPMLAYSQGGAGNLSGSVSAAAQNELGQFVSSALQARQVNGQLEQMEEQNENLREQNRNLQEQNKQIQANTQESKDRAFLTRQQAMTEVARSYREEQAGILDKLEAESRMRLMAAQTRNYDANSAYTALRQRLDKLDLPTKEIDAWTRRHPIGSYGRAIGTLFGDVGQVTNLTRGR
nr:MAG TPA: minor capsid protein [Microviridae sp.]